VTSSTAAPAVRCRPGGGNPGGGDRRRQDHLSGGPQEILTRDGRVVGLRCIRMQLTEPDSSGRKRPIPIPGSEFEVECDQVIPAIGQRPDLTALEAATGLNFSRYGTVEVNAVSYATDREGVFAGGDLQTDPGWPSVPSAPARRRPNPSCAILTAATSPRARAHRQREPALSADPRRRALDGPRQNAPSAPEKRRGNFDEVELGYDESTGRVESARCLNCGYCCECYQCVKPAWRMRSTTARSPRFWRSKSGRWCCVRAPSPTILPSWRTCITTNQVPTFLPAWSSSAS